MFNTHKLFVMKFLYCLQIECIEREYVKEKKLACKDFEVSFKSA